jgi:hypothetical protein
MEVSGGVLSLSVPVGGQEASREGVVEERERHSGVVEGDGVKKGNDGGQRLLWRPSGTGGEEKGRGVWGLVPHGGENGEERGGGVGRHGGGQLGQHCCHAIGEVGGARVTRRERLTGGTGDVGARWVAAGCERE